MQQVVRGSGRRLAWTAPRTAAAFAAACQAATVLVTWPLWPARTSPPNLPAISGLASFDYGLAVVATSVAAVVWPRVATPLCLAVLAAAMAGDQIRLQPEVVSLGLLMALPLLGSAGVAVSRFHLSSLWLWSGIHKLLSTGWSAGGAAFIASSLRSPGLRPAVVIGLPAIEMALGAASLWRRAWPVVRWAAPALHAGILLTLSPLFADWNSAVWPWNVGLAVVAYLLFRPEPAEPSEQSDRRAAKMATVAGAALLAYPALFYAGSVDAYLAHNLYTSNTGSASVCHTPGACAPTPFDTFGSLNVPLPPEPRLFRALFDRTCGPGNQLLVVGRATVFTDPPSRTTSPCRRGTLAAE